MPDGLHGNLRRAVPVSDVSPRPLVSRRHGVQAREIGLLANFDAQGGVDSVLSVGTMQRRDRCDGDEWHRRRWRCMRGGTARNQRFLLNYGRLADQLRYD